MPRKPANVTLLAEVHLKNWEINIKYIYICVQIPFVDAKFIDIIEIRDSFLYRAKREKKLSANLLPRFRFFCLQGARVLCVLVIFLQRTCLRKNICIHL